MHALSSGWLWDSALVGVSRYAVLAVGFVVSAAIARYLGPAGRGEYSTAAALAAFIIQLANCGLHATNTLFVARAPDIASRLFANSLYVSGVLGLMAALVGVALALHFGQLDNVTAHTQLLAVVSVPVLLFYSLAQSLAAGLSDFRTVALVDGNVALVSSAIVGTLIATRMLSPAAVLLASASAAAAGVWLLRRRIPQLGGSTPDFVALRIMLKVGTRPWMSGVAAGIIARLDTVSVAATRPLAEVGQYSVAATLVAAINAAGASAALTLLPRLISIRDRRERVQTARRAVITIALIGGAVFVGVAWFAEPLVTFVFGERYRDSGAFLVLLLPGSFALTVETVLVQIVNADNYPMSVALIWVASAVLAAAGYFWLTPHLGAAGAAISWSAAHISLFAGVAAIAWQRARVDVGGTKS